MTAIKCRQVHRDIAGKPGLGPRQERENRRKIPPKLDGHPGKASYAFINAGLEMNELEQFVTEQNVWHYIDLLAFEPNAEDRRVYAHLLRVEEDRFAKEASRLDAIETWIRKCDGHIARHRALLEKHDTMDRSLCERLIQGMIDIRNTLLSLRQAAADRVDASAAFLAQKPSQSGE